MTNQEIFNRVCEHLMKQGKRAEVSEEGTCQYRTPDGLKCAIGCLIPDELYDARFEGRAVTALVTKPEPYEEVPTALFRDAIKGAGIDVGESYGVLLAMQGVHDNSKPAQWASRLRTLASTFGLNPPDCIQEEAPQCQDA